MELQYEKAMEEHNLEISDLPEDAQVGIQNINDLLKGVRMQEGKGNQVAEKTLKKIKAMDKWVYFEILDFVEDNDSGEVNDSGDDNGGNEERGGVEQQEETNKVDDKRGAIIDDELTAMHLLGKKEITLEELKGFSKTAYSVVFDNYDESGDNGVETSNFLLIETDEKVFTLTKK